ncbi:MAG TPA: hypothetical protein VMP67_02765 [Candidatus Limnocylindria bacterium]|nr:hypothetical protein [Candidatus Limnocylindria bacterium]
MALVSMALWIGGVILVVVGVLGARGPFSRMTELDRLADNARRYDSWRGGRRTAAADEGTTGADVMRQVLRRRVLLWGAVAAAGIVLTVAGFVLR